MIEENLVATPELLHLFASIQPDANWQHAVSLMQALQKMGFDEPKSEEDEFSSDSSQAAEFTQVWHRNNEEGATAYFARSRMGTIGAATLTWTLGAHLSSSQGVQAVKQSLVGMSEILGPVHAVLDQTAAWVKDGCAGSMDEMAASACWSREGVSASRPTLDAKEYQIARRALVNPITFSVVLEKDASKQWLVIGVLSALS